MLLGDVNIHPYYSAKYDLCQLWDFFLFFFTFLSSYSIRTAGETVSSYCPERTAQKNAAKNPLATTTPMIIKIIITDIIKDLVYMLAIELQK